jgi:hypothetical protein
MLGTFLGFEFFQVFEIQMQRKTPARSEASSFITHHTAIIIFQTPPLARPTSELSIVINK